MTDSHPRPRPRPGPQGFSTRALAFEVEGGRAAGRAVIDALRLPEPTARLGSVHTLVVQPPSTSHRQSTEADLLDAGIAPGLLRVSVGLEDLEDLQADLVEAHAAARAAMPALGAV